MALDFYKVTHATGAVFALSAALAAGACLPKDDHVDVEAPLNDLNFPLTPDQIVDTVNAAGYDPNIRGESLALDVVSDRTRLLVVNLDLCDDEGALNALHIDVPRDYDADVQVHANREGCPDGKHAPDGGKFTTLEGHDALRVRAAVESFERPRTGSAGR